MSSVEERLQRLERCVLALAIMVSGEAQDKGTPEELEALVLVFSNDMKNMAKEMKS